MARVPLPQLARLVPLYKSGYVFALYPEKLGAGVNTEYMQVVPQGTKEMIEMEIEFFLSEFMSTVH